MCRPIESATAFSDYIYRIAGFFFLGGGVKSSCFSWLSSEPRNIYPQMIS